MARRIAIGLVGALVMLAVVVGVNTWRQGSRQLAVPPLAPLPVDERAVAESLAAAIRARTISSETDAAANADQFEALHAHLRARYPRLHAALQREVVGGLSLLYTWKGSDPSAPGIGLMAHQDVVPIAPGTEASWTVEPFSGAIQDGFVWGRGSWDDKGNLVAQMEAVERLVAAGFQPRRTVYLILGADEEVGGARGAREMASLLAARGVRLDFVIDEGLLITRGVVAGVDAPIAAVGVGEKGYLSVLLRVTTPPGHSSQPPPPGTSAIGRMSAALARLDANPMPGAIHGVARELCETLGPEMGGFGRVAMSNLWLFEPVVRRRLEAGPATNAMLRTTTALTMVRAGIKDNVLPGQAEAVVNFRILPGDTRARVLEHVRRTVADDRIELSQLPHGSEPSRVSSTRSEAYRLVDTTIRELFPGTVVTPGLMVAATDSRHFGAVAAQTFTFSPMRARPEDLPRFHGTDERISLANLAELVRFYHRLVERGAR